MMLLEMCPSAKADGKEYHSVDLGTNIFCRCLKATDMK